MNKTGERQPRRTSSWPTSAGTTPDGHSYKAFNMLWGPEDADEFFRPFQEYITGVVGNLTREFWNLVQVKIEDADGSFRLGATPIPGANKSSRDPNLNTNILDGVYLDTTNGEAAVAYFYDISNPNDGVKAEATTTWDWEFESLPITLNSTGVNREYDGTSTNATYTVDPSDAEIKVAYSTDKTSWSDLEDFDADKFIDCTNVWARFVATKEGYLSATSESQVVIGPLPVTVTLVGSTNKYDAAGHTVTVNVDPKQDVGDSSRKTELSFSSSVDPTWSDWVAESKAVPPAFTNCGTYTVYAKMRNLPNYTNDITVSADGVISQCVITVTATAAKKTYGDGDPTFAWTWSGDYVTKEKSWIDSQIFANPESIKRIPAGAGSQERAGLYANALSSNVTFSAGQNYIVEFVPADFTIEPGQLVLTVAKYEGVYDGEGHTIDLQINVTNDAKSRICIRTSTDNANWFEWTSWPVGDIKDILPMATNVADSMTIYIQATNEWPKTLSVVPEPIYTRDSIGNYKPTSANATVTITKRPITLTTSSVNVTVPHGEIATFGEDKIKDAATLTPSEGLGYVSGEKFTYSNLAKNSTPGTIDATFDYAANTTIIENNYTVSCTYGKLTVQAIPPPPPPPVNPCGRKDSVNEGANVYQLQMQLRSTWGIPCSSDGRALRAQQPGRVERHPHSGVLRGQRLALQLHERLLDAREQLDRRVGAEPAKFFSQPAITWDLLNIIGVSADQFEAAFTFKGKIDDYSNGASAIPLGADWSVTCAGQGTFSKSAGKYTFFSGYCAGDVRPPTASRARSARRQRSPRVAALLRPVRRGSPRRRSTGAGRCGTTSRRASSTGATVRSASPPTSGGD